MGGNGLFVTTSADGADGDCCDQPRTGEVSAYNLFYHQALLDGASLAAAGQPAAAANRTASAAALRSAVNAHLHGFGYANSSPPPGEFGGLASTSDGLWEVVGQK